MCLFVTPRSNNQRNVLISSVSLIRNVRVETRPWSHWPRARTYGCSSPQWGSRPSDSFLSRTEGLYHAERRPQASWLRQMESHSKDTGMAGLASVLAMAKRTTKEYRRKVDAATRCSGVWPHTWPDLVMHRLWRIRDCECCIAHRLWTLWYCLLSDCDDYCSFHHWWVHPDLIASAQISAYTT